jgi:HSP20 family molecular chaperone IbpA
MHFEKAFSNGHPIMYPLFFKVVIIPYYVDINKIEATYEQGIFKILLPYNKNLPKTPFTVQVKNRDK